MTPIEKFRKLTIGIGQLSGCPFNKVLGDAQDWKDRAKELIAEVFSEVPNTRESLLDRLKGRFEPQPNYVSADGTSSPTLPCSEQQRIFEEDLSEVKDVMGECCREFERLSAKYR